jgi:predicted ATPase
VRQGGSEMLLVSGCSGIGKSFLVSEFRRLLPRDKCFFISGKNDQYKRNLPYASIIDAFSEFISKMLTESRDNIAVWRKRILDAIGLNGQVIIDCIPDLELITGNQPHVQKHCLRQKPDTALNQSLQPLSRLLPHRNNL